MDPEHNTTAHPRARVLLVEDESKLRETLVEGLRMENWTVVGARTCRDAWQQLETHEFDLIVLEWMLPDGDGLEIVRRLRARGAMVPILMITAQGDGQVREILPPAGITEFLAKPFGF